MTPIEKYEVYLVGRGMIISKDPYVNEQVERLRLYPCNVFNPAFTGGAFVENNTNRIQVYVSDNVEYFL